ncbi:hypothetical protein P8452_29693 [Trifolium repens]|nr:hypothetical protein P8452_29693 [Trifolium repens]
MAHVEHDLIVLEVPKERTSKKFSFRFHRMPLIKKLLKPLVRSAELALMSWHCQLLRLESLYKSSHHL